MITKEELRQLLKSTETYRIERTVSTGNKDKFSEAICAFSNDLPGSHKNGYLIIGAEDDGEIKPSFKVTDALLKNIAALRSDGNILPIPTMSVDRYEFPEGELLVCEVQPSPMTPVRYRGRVFVRIGPRRDIASEDEERILTERRTANMATFDVTPCLRAKLSDLNVDMIRNGYLPKAVDADVLAADNRSLEEQMASVGLYDMDSHCPTNAAVILFAHRPKQFIPGAYVQYVKFGGNDKASDILNERMFTSCLFDLLPKLDTFTENSVVTTRPVPVTAFREEQVVNYPREAIRELLLNAPFGDNECRRTIWQGTPRELPPCQRLPQSHHSRGVEEPWLCQHVQPWCEPRKGTLQGERQSAHRLQCGQDHRVRSGGEAEQ